MLPDHFVVGGAQRSGTTWLARLLDLHPQIAMARPLRPEPKFFLRPDAGAATREEYASLFPPAPAGVRLLGEKSTSYLERPEAAAPMRRLLPGVRLVFVLRDPVERAVSNYRFSVDNGVETESMEVAFRDEERRRRDWDRRRFSVSPFAYLRRGDYADLLAPWEAALGRERLTLLLYEDLRSDTAATLRRLLLALGADADLQPAPPDRAIDPAPGAEALDRALRDLLVERFAAGNRRLARRYGLDLSAWRLGAPVSVPDPAYHGAAG